jgi:ubiquinone/menaquinone biosynthesis C-methylase UbiE
MASDYQNSLAFDRAADYYDDTRGFPPGEEAHAAALMARAGGLAPGDRVLEVGMGTGRIALPLAAHVRVYGVDLSRPMLRRLLAKRADQPVYPTEGDAVRLPFRAASFDAAVAVHVFHLIPGWRAALDEIARVLRPGAMLVAGGTGAESGFASLWRAWHESLPSRATIGARSEEGEDYLIDAGWQPVGERLIHRYPIQRTPGHFVTMLAQRQLSSTWLVTDAELAAGIAAVQRVLDDEFENPDQPVILQATFEAQAYRPSAR